MKKLTIQDLYDKKLILFETRVGSTAYGTNLPTSDIDIKGIFIQPVEDILGTQACEQVNDDTNDTVFYELRRFLELLATNNPTVIELLNSPDDCIISKHPVFDLILEHKNSLITKKCRDSFAGYASMQIKKAQGLNKKIVNPIAKERKSPLDFCYVIDGHGTKSMAEYLKENNLDQKFCGAVNIPHVHDLYGMYYDKNAECCFSENIPEKYKELNKKHNLEFERPNGFGYKGLLLGIGEDFASNTVRLSSIPKEEASGGPMILFSYNKDGYSKYCKDYKAYWDWVENRNEARYEDTSNHGKNFDGKNMLHCFRLMNMAIEILDGKGVNVRRSPDECKFLIDIRKGKYDYDDLLKRLDILTLEIERAYSSSLLPETIEPEFIHELIVKIRKQYYMHY